MRAIAAFTLDSFMPEPPYREDDGVKHGRIRIEKTFHGEVEGRGYVEMLANQNEGGAGYVALERIVGSVQGRSGGFSLLHIGTAVEDKTWARWPVVPGSGTGELKTIRGDAQIDIDAGGHHTFTLEYELD